MTIPRFKLAVASGLLMVSLAALACGDEETPSPPESAAPAPQTEAAQAEVEQPAPAEESQTMETSAAVDADTEPASEPETAPVVAEIESVLGPRSASAQLAPEFTGIIKWLNSEDLTLESQRGNVVLIDFWTYTCINCIRTLPFIKDWHDKYADEGLVIVGVHTPEFEFEKDTDNVIDAIGRFELEYAVAQDNDFGTWQAYNNRYWPAKYLIDKDGYIRYTHFGEGAYAETEQAIRELLGESGSSVTSIEPSLFPDAERDPRSVTNDPMTSVTRELYAGFERNYNTLLSGSVPPYVHHVEYYEQPNLDLEYEDPDEHLNHFLYLHGLWNNGLESLNHARETEDYEDYIALRFYATEVNAVMEPRYGTPYEVRVLVDGSPLPASQAGVDVMWDGQGNSFILVDEPKMYRIVRSSTFSDHELNLSSNSKDFALFAFTFGSYVEEEDSEA